MFLYIFFCRHLFTLYVFLVEGNKDDDAACNDGKYRHKIVYGTSPNQVDQK